MFLTTTLYFIHAYACLHVRAHARKRINNIVLIFQDRKEIRIQLEKYYPENISIYRTFLPKNLVEWKIVSTFALAFEKSSIPQGDKERVL